MEHITEWAHAGESHAGVIMVVYQATRARFRVLIRRIEERTSPEQWTDRIRWLGLS